MLREARAPAAALQALGDNGITLELGVWVDDPHIQGNLQSTLYRAVLKQFADNGVQSRPRSATSASSAPFVAVAGARLPAPGAATPARGNPLTALRPGARAAILWRTDAHAVSKTGFRARSFRHIAEAPLAYNASDPRAGLGLPRVKTSISTG